MRLHLALYRWWSLLLVFTAVGSQQIIGRAGPCWSTFPGEFEGVIDSYVDENKRMAGELDVEQFKGLSSYKTEAVSEIYRFLNGQVYRVTITCLTGTGIWFFHQQPVQCHTVHREITCPGTQRTRMTAKMTVSLSMTIR